MQRQRPPPIGNNQKNENNGLKRETLIGYVVLIVEPLQEQKVAWVPLLHFEHSSTDAGPSAPLSESFPVDSNQHFLDKKAHNRVSTAL